MVRFIVKRLIQLLPVLLVMSFIVFAITNLLPGDPTIVILGEESSLESRAILREELGLNDPLVIQYFRWLARVSQGDFGRSIYSREPVADLLARKIPLTLQLTVISVFISVIIGIPAGIVAAVKRNTWADVLAMFFSMSGVAIPFFWLGILLIVFFSLTLGWFPPSGYVSFMQNPWQSLRHMVLPSLTVGLPMAASIVRQTRASFLEVLSSDYITTARAKGVIERRVLSKHALKNAMISVVTVIGLQMGRAIGGAVITETVFSLPGIGRMIVDGIFTRDFPVLQAGVLFVVMTLVIVNLITDILYFCLDPKLEY